MINPPTRVTIGKGKIKIVEFSRLLNWVPFFNSQDAITLGRTVRFKNGMVTAYFWEEVCHVCQFESIGFWSFLYQYRLRSYKNKPLEIEAKACHSHYDVIEKYPDMQKIVYEFKILLSKQTA